METSIVLSSVGICALLINLALIPVIIRIAHKRKWYDLPNGRKIHTNPIPRLGGIGIFASFLIASVLVPGVLVLLLPGYSYPYALNHLPVLAAFCLICALGLVDDFRSLRARLKFFFQLLAGVLVTLGGYTISVLSIPGIGEVELGIWGYPITVLWIVGISNALNFIDGIDGFAGGITSFAALSMGVIFLFQGHSVSMLLAFALLGSVLSFLIFNAPPARIFMGDCGAYLFGFTLSVLPLLDLGGADFLGNISAAIVLLTIPIIDTAYAIVRRLRKRQSPLAPDKEHIHHKLMDLGLKEWEILRIIGGFSVFLSAAAIVVGLVRGLTGIIVFFSSWAVCIALYVILAKTQAKASVQKASAENH